MCSKAKNLLERAKSELLEEVNEVRVEEIKERLREIARARATLDALRTSLTARLAGIAEEDRHLLDTINPLPHCRCSNVPY